MAAFDPRDLDIRIDRVDLRYTVKLPGKIREVTVEGTFDEDLNLIDNKQEEKQMKKSDLKVGMRVKYRTPQSKVGESRIVMADSRGDLVLCTTGGYFRLDQFSDDLKWLSYEEHSNDIVEVYDNPSNSNLLDPTVAGDLLWERKPQVKEMTVEAISKELGYDIKIVK